MSETFWIIGEIIVGIALLGLLSAVITAVLVPLLNKEGKRSGATEILGERFARGELTREQYDQMRQDLGISANPEDGLHTPQEDGRKVARGTISRQER
jgi:uncharacterized membrane protein